MKKKRLVCDEWTVITSKRYRQINMDNEFFKGTAALLYIDEVFAPQVWEFYGEKNVICDAGMKWLTMVCLMEHRRKELNYGSRRESL